MPKKVEVVATSNRVRPFVLDLWKYRETTVKELAEMLELKVYDKALPQSFVDDCYTKTGVYLPGHAVWCYDDVKIWGECVPVTRKGAVALEIYYHICKMEATL